ncbi:uncharacterized protein LOC143890711 [Tasmannia lanceolata]|uniref:uncharacterized protein LOC143890711 n=1 Tax=Tasmannia lanceolata TaxID=3420 RepID=UPI0040642FA3
MANQQSPSSQTSPEAAISVGASLTLLNSSMYSVDGDERAVIFDRIRGVLDSTVGEAFKKTETGGGKTTDMNSHKQGTMSKEEDRTTRVMIPLKANSKQAREKKIHELDLSNWWGFGGTRSLELIPILRLEFITVGLREHCMGSSLL